MNLFTQKKLLILAQILLEIVAISGYIIGIIPYKFWQFGFLTVMSLGVIVIICNQLTITEKLKSTLNLGMSALAFVPILGWLAIIYGIKLSFEHIAELVDQLKNKTTPTTKTKVATSKNTFQSDIIDVEVI